MKANNIILLMAGCLTSFLVSCSYSEPYSEEVYNNTLIDVYPSNISLGEDEFSGEFSVYSSESWYIYDCPSWIKVSRDYGYADDYVSFTVDENNGSSSRSGYIEIRTDGDFTKRTKIMVAQPPTVQFDASMSTTNYSASGDWWTLSIKAASTRSWTISKSDSWVHLGNSYSSSYSYSGKGNEDVKIYVDANTYSYSRSSTLTVKCGTKSKSITITQDGKSNKAPFVIKSVEVRNVDYNGNAITDFGETIYSYQTKYLQPKLNITVNTAGTYTVYTKLYRPNGSLSTGSSSPTGYSFSDTETLTSRTTWWSLSGWGSNTAGHWSSGQYRWEFWYNGSKIGEKSFTIY